MRAGPFLIYCHIRGHLNEYAYGISNLSSLRARAIAVRNCRTHRIHRDPDQRSAWPVALRSVNDCLRMDFPVQENAIVRMEHKATRRAFQANCHFALAVAPWKDNSGVRPLLGRWRREREGVQRAGAAQSAVQQVSR